MSNSEDLKAIKVFFDNARPKFQSAADLKIAFEKWEPTVSHFLGVSDDDMARARRYRDDFHKANGEKPLPQGQQLTAAEAEYFQNMPVVDVTHKTASEAHADIWTRKGNAPLPPPESHWLSTGLGIARKVLRLGMQDKNTETDIKDWQNVIGVKADGKFGPNTKAVTIKWQAARGIKADGIVGASSWEAAVRSGKATEEAAPVAERIAAAVAPTVARGAAPKAPQVQAQIAQLKEAAKAQELNILPVPNTKKLWLVGGIVTAAILLFVAIGKPKTVPIKKTP
jgi:peptidoglycan hydrolase-like protein with peptidoglycan-binding domain